MHKTNKKENKKDKEKRKQLMQLPYFKNTQPHLRTPILLAKRQYSSFKLSKNENAWQIQESSKLSSSRKKQESMIMQKLKLKTSNEEKEKSSSSVDVSASSSNEASKSLKKNSQSEQVSYIVSSKQSRRTNQGLDDSLRNLPILVGTVEFQNFMNGALTSQPIKVPSPKQEKKQSLKRVNQLLEPGIQLLAVELVPEQKSNLSRTPNNGEKEELTVESFAQGIKFLSPGRKHRKTENLNEIIQMSKEVKKFNQLSSSANTGSKNSKRVQKESSPSNRMEFERQSSELEPSPEIYGQTGGSAVQQTTVLETRMETEHIQTTMRTQNDLLLEKDMNIRDDVDSILKIEMQRTQKRHSIMQQQTLFYPDNPRLEAWNVYIMGVLILTCIITPLRLAMVPSGQEETLFWKLVLYAIDLCFFVDILIIFNTAIYDQYFCFAVPPPTSKIPQCTAR